MNRKISISEIRAIEPEFEKYNLKEETCYHWLLAVRKYLIENNIAKFTDIMPSKKDLAEFLGVSTGCVQNAIRVAEDRGYFISKQCIGTMIADVDNKDLNHIKMFSKKDKALIEIKKHLLQRGYNENEIIPSTTELAHEIKTSVNTTRLAIIELVRAGVLRKEIHTRNVILFLNSKIKLSEKEKGQSSEIKNKNLVKILKEKVKKYLIQNYKAGDKILSNKELAKIFNVSIRTMNSCMKEFHKEKIILSRRGKYGSIFLGGEGRNKLQEKSMFMSDVKSQKEIKKNYAYRWENAYTNIKQYILKNHEAGDKTLSMQQFAEILNTSVTTIKRAVGELTKEGILYPLKGKYGGLFIAEMPQKEESFQWLIINPKYFD